MQTLLIIVGVAAGVAVVAYISALITGLQSNTLEKTLGAQAHVTVSAPDDVVMPAARAGLGRRRAGADAAARAAAALDRQLAGAGAGARSHARRWRPSRRWWPAPGWRSAARPSKSIALIGVDLDRYDRIVHLRSKVVAGVARLGPGEGIIGRELADDLGVRVGDRVEPASPATRHRLAARHRAGGPGRARAEPPHRDRAAARRAEPGGPARRRHQPRPGAGRRVGRAGAGRRAGAALPLQGGELAGGQCAAGVGAECAVGQHGADPRRGDGGGGAGHRQRAGGVGGAEAPRDRHPARDGRHAGPGAARLPAAGRDRRRARLGAGRAAGGGADLGLHDLRARLRRPAAVRDHAGAGPGAAHRRASPRCAACWPPSRRRGAPRRSTRRRRSACEPPCDERTPPGTADRARRHPQELQPRPAQRGRGAARRVVRARQGRVRRADRARRARARARCSTSSACSSR